MLLHRYIPYVHFCLPFFPQPFPNLYTRISALMERPSVSNTDFLAQMQRVPTPSCTRSDSFQVKNVVLPCTSEYQLLLGCFSDYLKTYLHITFLVLPDGTIFLLEVRVKNVVSGWSEFKSLFFHFLAVLKFFKVSSPPPFFSHLYWDMIDIQHRVSLRCTIWRFDIL